MPVLKSIKDVVVGRAFQLAGSPKVSKLVSDPRLMNAAMKAMSVGGVVKSNMDKAGRLAAGAFGLATHEEMISLRNTIQQLEDQLASLSSAPKN
ncbi:MAG: hypothetical protein ABSB49_11030 [Polyangia bacterium]|jgi:hypothetical protein